MTEALRRPEFSGRTQPKKTGDDSLFGLRNSLGCQLKPFDRSVIPSYYNPFSIKKFMWSVLGYATPLRA